MRRVLKWIGIVLLGLLGLLVVAIAGLYIVARGRLNREYEIQLQPVTIPTDEASLQRGEHLVNAVSECRGCHGEDLGGLAFFDDPMVGVLDSPNLTAGEGGVGGQYTDEDWVRAIRHGVRPSGRPLLVMPAQHFYRYDDEDLGAIIAYIKSAPPVNRVPQSRQLSIPGHVLLAAGAFGPAVLPAEIIDHDGPHPGAPEPAASAEYGEHLTYVAVCRECHSSELSGGEVGPGGPIAPNLTPGGDLADWTEDDFITLIRTGTTPDGRQIADEMPWRTYRNMSDEELQAIWLYLQSLPALESFTR